MLDFIKLSPLFILVISFHMLRKILWKIKLRLSTSASEGTGVCVCLGLHVWLCVHTRLLMTHWVGFDSQHSQTAVKWVINIQEHLFKVHTRTHGTCITSATGRALTFPPWRCWHLPEGACIVMATGTVGFAYVWTLMNARKLKLNVIWFFFS